jgi:hypothetical protein
VVIIIPGSGRESKPLFSLLHLVALSSKMQVAESKVGDRSVSHISVPPVTIAWWVDGEDTVLAVGTDPPEALVKRTAGGGPRLSENPLFQRVQGFKDFETAARAYVDVAALAKAARARGKEIAKVIDDLGLDNLQSMLLYSGFDGAAERSIVEWHLTGAARKGLFRVIAGQPFRLSDLPPAPPDAVSISAMNLDLAAIHDVAVPVIETILGAVSPGDKPQVKEGLKQIDAALGIDVRKDLLGSLGARFVHYTSPSEGALNFGEVLLFQVKDAEKLRATLDQAIKGLASSTGANIRVKKRMYHGVELREVHVKQQGFFFLPTYAIHKDWLVISYFPQPVQGFVLRTAGSLPAWKPDPTTQESLDKLPKEFVALSVSDPRPTVKQVLTLAPVVITLINSLEGAFNIDAGALPNAHEATRHLFPNVSVVTDEGKTLRSETRASLSLPFELTGVDTFGIVFIFGALVPFIFG